MKDEQQAEASRDEIASLKKLMERLYYDFVQATGKALAAWYEAEMREVVREQYERSQQLGIQGMIDLKNRFAAFVLESTAKARTALAECYWSHLDDGGKPGREDAYTLQPGREHPITQAIAWLYGTLGDFLSDNGYRLPRGMFESTGNPPALRYTKPIQLSPGMRLALEAYSVLHQQVVQKLACLRSLIEEEAKSKAEALWDGAFTLDTEIGVDWEAVQTKAVELAEGYLLQYDSWEDEFSTWLEVVQPDEDGCFETFLHATDSLNKFRTRVRKLYAVALIKVIKKRLGLRELDSRTMRAINDVAKMQPVRTFYQHYDDGYA